MDNYELLVMVGRPASGKSEIIDYLVKCDAVERSKRFRISYPDVIDDFPMIWTWFEEDKILSQRLGQPRLHTDEEGYFIYSYFWNLLIERINLEYQKRVRDHLEYHKHNTTIIEFARGSEHGGYAEAFNHLSDDILSQAKIIYVRVAYEESLRKNRLRFNPERPDSILEHALPDRKLERMYRYDDWDALTSANQDHLLVRDHRVPYVVFENEDDVTTDNPSGLAERLKTVLSRLDTR